MALQGVTTTAAQQLTQYGKAIPSCKWSADIKKVPSTHVRTSLPLPPFGLEPAMEHLDLRGWVGLHSLIVRRESTTGAWIEWALKCWY